jgi:uncharacterized membrane protein YkvA (DUF1232 family)
MALPTWNLDGSLAEGIAGIRANDIDAVRAEFPDKFASVRAILANGKFGRLRELAANLRTLFDLLTDRTFSVPWRTTAAAVFALAYFILSFDIIPDVIPVLGFLDDALVVAEVVYLLSDDLRRFREHRARAEVVAAAVPPDTTSQVRLVA